MSFKLTYSDGHETDYDDETKWEVENGVVKLGSDEGKWTVFISPSHWATLELTAGKDKGEGKKDDDKDKGKDKDEDKDKDKDEDKDKDKDEDKDNDEDDDEDDDDG